MDKFLLGCIDLFAANHADEGTHAKIWFDDMRDATAFLAVAGVYGFNIHSVFSEEPTLVMVVVEYTKEK